MKISQSTPVNLGICLLLTACVVTSNTTSVKQIRERTLDDGTVTRVGFVPVEDSWKCIILDKKTSNAGLNKLKGVFKISGRFEVMENDAVDYANTLSIKPNYIFMYIPTEVISGVVDTSVFTNAQTTYYQCQTPPAVKDNIKELF
ncbi:hypothetical protein AAKU67_002397 [Oxalobacteraceae bacterium GrIS 2.11]